MLEKEKMKCHKCDKVIIFEKMITPDGRCYHLQCWDKDEESGGSSIQMITRVDEEKNDCICGCDEK